MKKCPYCAEKILDEAVVCRYCHRDLPPQQNGVSQSNASAVQIASSKAKNRKKGLVIAVGVLTGIIVFCISLYFIAIALINRAIPGMILPNVPKIKLWNAGKIYFTQAYDNSSLFVMNADGTGLNEIPHKDITYSSVSVSQNGQQIVFVDDTDALNLFIMNADGSSVMKLISNCACSDPVITPDGMEIIFEHDFSLFAINIDGTNQRELLPQTVVWIPNDPDISSDGEKILFLGSSDPYNNIYVANIDGTGITQFTFDRKARWMSPVWSPDGKTFAVVKYNFSSLYSSELYLFNSDGSGSKKLATISSGSIAWAPSGKWILISGKRLKLLNITSSKVYQYPKIIERDLLNLQWAP